MRLVKFFKSPMGNLAIFFGFIAVGGLMLYQSNARARAQSAQLTKVEAAEPAMPATSIIRNAVPFKASAAAPADADSAHMQTASGKSSGAPKPLPISLFIAAKTGHDAQDLSSNY
jgi:hypothetical protein